MTCSYQLTGHRELLRLPSRMATLGTADRLPLHILDSLPLHMVITETHLAAKTRVLAQPVAGAT